MGDTLAANAFRALALLARLERAAPQRAERRSTSYLGPASRRRCGCGRRRRCSRARPPAETDWNGAAVPEGTQILISNTFNHRDPDRHEYADRFAPEEWTRGRCRRGLVVQPPEPRPAGLPRRRHRDVRRQVRCCAELLAARRSELLERRRFDPAKPLPAHARLLRAASSALQAPRLVLEQRVAVLAALVGELGDRGHPLVVVATRSGGRRERTRPAARVQKVSAM